MKREMLIELLKTGAVFVFGVWVLAVAGVW